MAERFAVTDAFYNTDPTSTVRGVQHVLATVDEDSYDEQDGTPTTTDDHPVMWCQDLEGGRSFYTGLGHNPATFANANVRSNLAGAIKWAAGLSDPTYSDCGATVLANYKQVKISAPPNLNEPIGFDQLPDGRIIQTARAGQVRLHDPEGGTTTVLTTPSEFPQGVYTHSEDGLYGPAVDPNFAQNKWVYLYYSPAVVKDVPQSDGTTRTFRTPTGQAGELPIAAPTTGPNMATWDPYVGYFQLSRFKFVDAAPGAPAHLDMSSEQEIMRVPVNRGACCHVGGDIDFDKAGNLWLVTGDDTPAGGGNSGGFGPFNDMKTNETQTVRVTNATDGTFTLTFAGQTTAPIAWNATAAAVQSALEALSNVEPGDVVATGGPVNTANVSVNFRGAYSQENVRADDVRRHGADRHDPDHHERHVAGGRLVQRAVRRRAARCPEHQRPARQGAAHQGRRRRLLHGSVRQPVRPRHAEHAAGDLRHGLPEPVPDPGRLEGHRLPDRLLARLPDPADPPRAAGHGPGRDRAGAGQLRLAGVHDAERPLLRVGLQHVHAAGPGQPAAVRVRQPGQGPGQRVALEHG